MGKTERNREIVDEFERAISDRGLAGKLKMEPIDNAFKRRQHFTTKADGTCVFTAYLWQLNSLPPEECSAEINRLIDNSAGRFGIGQAEA